MAAILYTSGSTGRPKGVVLSHRNMLTNAALDPFGKIPEFKYCAVKVTKGGAAPGDWAGLKGLVRVVLLFDGRDGAALDMARAAWKDAGHTREPRVSVSRSIFPIVDDRDRMVLSIKYRFHGPRHGVSFSNEPTVLRRLVVLTLERGK